MTGATIPAGENLTLTIFDGDVNEGCIHSRELNGLGGNATLSSWLSGSDEGTCDYNQSTDDDADDYDLCLSFNENSLIYSTLSEITNFELHYTAGEDCIINDVYGGESEIDGVCFGNVIPDDCGVCGGTCFGFIEDLEEGESQVDGCLECGCFDPWGTCLTCAGPTAYDADESGTIDDDEIFCDCEGNILDDCGVCNGDNLGVQNDPYPCDFNGDQKNLNNISHHH
jgi:hypothetical protein